MSSRTRSRTVSPRPAQNASTAAGSPLARLRKVVDATTRIVRGRGHDRRTIPELMNRTGAGGVRAMQDVTEAFVQARSRGSWPVEQIVAAVRAGRGSFA